MLNLFLKKPMVTVGATLTVSALLAWAIDQVEPAWIRDGAVGALQTVMLTLMLATIFTALSVLRSSLSINESNKRDFEDKVHERTRRLEAARDAAEAGNLEKSEFLRSMSHALRTPLNSIMGFSEVLMAELHGPLGDRYKEYSQHIKAAGDNLLTVVDDVLELSRVESGRLALHDQPADVARIVEDVLQRIAAEARNAAVELSVDMPRRPVNLLIDPLRLTQVLSNLAANAIAATPKGGTVELRFCTEGLVPVFSIADEGVGMTPTQIEVALKPFGQVENLLGAKPTGMGLGLPLAKRIVEAMGGGFTIDSNIGRGTRVTVALPSWRLLGSNGVAAVA